MVFRDDINVLRAFAIIGVLIFHFDSNLLSGGFAGVDVFFVISGYLMTSIIFKGQSVDFSYIKFMRSRFKRIVPAMIPLIFVVLLICYFIFPPSDYKNLSESSLASFAFISNVFYWKTAGYFDGVSKDNFLLHTWSLSIEWQFYLLYPIVLMFLRRFLSNEIIKWLLLSFVVISYLTVSIFSYLSPVASFYLLPTRAWEMAAGSIAFFYTFGFLKNSRLCSYIGFSIIVCSYFILSSNLGAWPNYYSFFPVAGTLLVLFSAVDTKITSNYILGKIGLYSYSIYLYHWPFLALCFFFNLNFGLTLSVLGLSIILSVVSFYLIERNNSFIRNVILSIMFSFILFLSFSSIITNGLPSRFDNTVKILDDSRFDYDEYRGTCFDSNSKYCIYERGVVTGFNNDSDFDFIFIGDSHAASLVYVFSKAVSGKVLFMGVGGCFPIPNVSNLKGNNFNCNKMMDDFNEILPLNPKAKVVVAARYSLYFKGSNEINRLNNVDSISFVDSAPNSKIASSIENNSSNLRNAFNSYWCSISENYPTYIIGPVPEFYHHIPNYLSRQYAIKGTRSDLELEVSDFLARNEEVLIMLKSIESECGVNLINPSDVLCDDKICRSVIDNVIIYFDENHLTKSGSNFLYKIFKGVN